MQTEYSDIKKLSDLSLSKSDRKKIRQDLILRLYNSLVDDANFQNYNELEAFLTLSKDGRDFVKNLRDAITGLTTMMSDYVDANISFDSWQAICDGREKVKKHNITKAIAIKNAAEVFRNIQNDWTIRDQEVMSTLPTEALIDRLNEEHLPIDTKKEISKYFSDKSVLAEKTKLEIRKFKADQLKEYQANRAGYKLPESK
jgi:hypothetical protein